MRRVNTKLFELKAFTLMELLIVIVILGTIISAAIPRYQKAIELTYERTAAGNLNVIRTAIEMYKIDHGGYPNGDMNDDAAINSTLGLMILPDQMIYSCTSDPTEYECAAQSPRGWRLHVMNLGVNESWAPAHCDPANSGCPSCTLGGGWVCPWDL